jgi:tetratricopeptide (TPR) repeat protein
METVQADFPKPIAPPKSETLTPIGPPVSTPVIKPSSKPSASIEILNAAPTLSKTPVIPAAHRHLPLLIEQMLANKITPQQAWDEKLITVDDLLWIFTSYIDEWGSFHWKFNADVRRRLVKLIVQYGGDKLQVPEKLSPTVRLWIADYYQNISDAKCLFLCESILSEFKEPLQGESPLLFQTIERIARYHSQKGEHLKAAQAWERFFSLSAIKGRLAADVLVEAARAYSGARDNIKAFSLYVQVPIYHNGWSTGMSYIDQATDLMAENEHERARELLTRNVTGDRADEIKVAMLTLLGRSYLKTGNRAKAAQYAQQALDQFKSLTNYRFNDGTEWMVLEAKDILKGLNEDKQSS